MTMKAILLQKLFEIYRCVPELILQYSFFNRSCPRRCRRGFVNSLVNSIASSSSGLLLTKWQLLLCIFKVSVRRF